MNEPDLTVEGLLVGHLARLLSVITAGGDDETWQRRVSTGVLAFERLVEGLSGIEVDTAFDIADEDPDIAIPECLAALQTATSVAADSGLIPSRRIFVEDVTPLLEAIAEARGIE